MKQRLINMLTVTATEIQNNFGKYLQAVQLGNEIIILKNNYDEKAARDERIKYH